MNKNYDRQKILENLVDPNVSIILSELEDGDKESSYLEQKFQISNDDINQRLSYVIQHDFVIIKQNGNKTIFSADKEKLNKIMENDEQFTGIIDGLTELDQYLN